MYMNISNELGKLGEKAMEEWFLDNGYDYVHLYNSPFQGAFFRNDIEYIVRRPEEYPWLNKKEIDDLEMLNESLMDIDFKEGTHREGRGYHHAEKYPDYLAKIPDLTFIEVKVNNAKLQPNQRTFMKYASQLCGIETLVARIKVDITVGDIEFQSP